MPELERTHPVKSPNSVDVQVGQKIRLQRQVRGISQSALAAELGVTFQQVQKYEKGMNRVSASKLVKIAECLGVPVAYFFSDLMDSRDGQAASQRQVWSDLKDFLMSPEGIALNVAFRKIQDTQTKKRFLALVKAIAE